MMKIVLPALAVLISGRAPPTPVGTWRIPAGLTAQVRRCGKNVCGTINGQPVLNSMRQTSRNAWTGIISDVRSHSFYDGTISLVSDDSLLVHGCIRGGGMCGDQTWTRIK